MASSTSHSIPSKPSIKAEMSDQKLSQILSVHMGLAAPSENFPLCVWLIPKGQSSGCEPKTIRSIVHVLKHYRLPDAGGGRGGGGGLPGLKAKGVHFSLTQTSSMTTEDRTCRWAPAQDKGHKVPDHISKSHRVLME